MNEVRPFHATIVTGAPEQRRAKAITLAQALVCEGEQKPCGVCRHCRKVLQGIHPDVISVEQFMEEKDVGSLIKVDAVRTLRNDAVIMPNEAQRKVYIIDQAETMNVNSQNALLKLLEEGPPYAAFLLLCSTAGALLETIRSRCAVVSAGQEIQQTQRDENALQLAQVLCTGSELEQAAFLASLEQSKLDKQGLDSFLSDLEMLFQEAAIGGVTGNFSCEESRQLSISIDRARLLRNADAAREAREMTVFHVAAGHILGWLGTKLLSIPMEETL